MRRDTLMLLVLWALMVALLQLRPISDVDVFEQLQAGQVMLDQRRLIANDPFTYTHMGESVPTIGWLAQVIFAGVYRLGSWSAVKILHVLMFSGAFFIVGISTMRCGNDRDERISLFALACALLLGFLTGLTNSSLRPQSFAVLCFAVLLAVAQSEWRLHTKLVVLAPVLVFWQNCHPSVILGLVALAGWGASAWFDSGKRWHAVSILMLVVAAQLATPTGWDLFAVSRTNAAISRDYLGVSEWLPAWSPVNLDALWIFWFGFALSITLLVKQHFKVRRSDLLQFLCMTGLACYAARFALFWGIVMVPIWARWIEAVRPPSLFAWNGKRVVERPAKALLPIVGLLLVLVIPSFRTGSIFDKKLPLHGISRLKTALSSGHIYNYREWGGPLIWAGYPGWKVAMDGRLYLYSKEEWENYNRAALGQTSLHELTDKHQPDAFFLRPSFHGGLITLLKESSEWIELYTDTTCSIYVKAL
jgi:hypothetical protein